MATVRVSLASRFRAGETIITAWSSLAVPIVSELIARAGYRAVTLDMQHGLHDIASVREGIASTMLGGAHAVVRTPVDEFPTASRVLDLGAEAVIMPMINSVDDAKALVAATKFPPLGARSWGPHRAAGLFGQESSEYSATANRETTNFAMIETPAAMAALDGILGVEGVDGIFVGPSDLSLTLSNGKGVDPKGQAAMEATANIARRARAAGRIAAVFCIDAEHARAAIAMGYQFVVLGTDIGIIGRGAQQVLKSLDD